MFVPWIRTHPYLPVLSAGKCSNRLLSVLAKGTRGVPGSLGGGGCLQQTTHQSAISISILLVNKLKRLNYLFFGVELKNREHFYCGCLYIKQVVILNIFINKLINK